VSKRRDRPYEAGGSKHWGESEVRVMTVAPPRVSISPAKDAFSRLKIGKPCRLIKEGNISIATVLMNMLP
jgi:hypothetical protein